MIRCDEDKVGFKVEYIRFNIGQSIESFTTMLGIDYNYYVNNIVKSSILYRIDIDVLYKLYYVMAELGSGIYPDAWIKGPARELIPIIRERIEEQVEYNEKLRKQINNKENDDINFVYEFNNDFYLIHKSLNQSAKLFCSINGISINEYNTLVKSADLKDIEINLSFKLYYVLREILNNKYISENMRNLCEQYIKMVNKLIEDFMNRSSREKSNANTRLKEE